MFNRICSLGINVVQRVHRETTEGKRDMVETASAAENALLSCGWDDTAAANKW